MTQPEKLQPKSFLDMVPKGMGVRAVPPPSEFDADYWNGRLIIYEEPDSTMDYAIGVDPAGGKGADRSVVQVIRIGDLTRPDEQVAEFASDFHGPHDLAPVAALVGRLYCGAAGDEALLNVECNGAYGDSCLLDLRSRCGYSNFFVWKIYDRTTKLQTNRIGWWTTNSTRPKLIAAGHHAITNGDLIVNSEFLLDEMEDFQGDLYMAKAQAVSGAHDDRVMALLMAYWAAHDSERLAGMDVAQERRRLKAAGSIGTVKEKEQGRVATWQNQAISYKEMMESWDEHVLD